MSLPASHWKLLFRHLSEHYIALAALQILHSRRQQEATASKHCQQLQCQMRSDCASTNLPPATNSCKNKYFRNGKREEEWLKARGQEVTIQVTNVCKKLLTQRCVEMGKKNSSLWTCFVGLTKKGAGLEAKQTIQLPRNNGEDKIDLIKGAQGNRKM